MSPPACGDTFQALAPLRRGFLFGRAARTLSRLRFRLPMLRSCLRNIANELFEARPCVGMELTLFKLRLLAHVLTFKGSHTDIRRQDYKRGNGCLSSCAWSLCFRPFPTLKQVATLWHFAGVSTPTAQAVFSGTRIEGAMQFINRIADAQRWKKSKRNQIQHIFTQLGHLNKLRNEILHYGAWMLAPGAWIVSNKEFAHMIERIRSIQISPETLREATADVENIQARLKALARLLAINPSPAK